jgi:hypothetical protein
MWVLPFLALLDIISTFYAAGQGYSLGPYEGGSFSTFFVAGSIYGYVFAVIYMLIIVGVAYLLWHIKNRVLKPSSTFDKGLFIFVVIVTVYLYARLTAAFLLGFFLPELVSRGTSIPLLAVLIYSFSVLSLSIYLWRTVLSWVKTDGSKKTE